MDKFEAIRAAGIYGSRESGVPAEEAGGPPGAYEVTTDDILARLLTWDARYGIDLVKLEGKKITLHFERLPPNLTIFCDELVGFCPDAVFNGFDDPEDLEAHLEATHALDLWWE